MHDTDLNRLLASCPIAYLITSLDGQIIAANLAAHQLLIDPADIELKSLLDRRLEDFVAPADHDRLRSRLVQFQRPEVHMPETNLVLQNDHNRNIFAKLSACSAYDHSGQIHIYWWIQDMRQREAALQALQQVNQTLEQQVQYQTQELNRVNNVLQKKIKTLRHSQAAFKQQTQQQRLIDTLMYRIHQTTNLDEISDVTVTEVRQFLNTDRVIIYRFQPDWSGRVVVESAAPGIMPILYSTIDEPCFRSGYVPLYQQGRVRAITDIYTDKIAVCHRNLLAKFQVRANLVVPILQDNTLWGLLIAHHCQAPRSWSQREITLLSKLAIEAGIAIRQAMLYEALQQRAIVDGLTEVANRRHFDQSIQAAWQQGLEQNYALTLILADVDFFKKYNDTYGHPAGDECLKQVAQAMKMTFKRSDDLVARYGGEEFAILLSNTEMDEAIALLGNLRAAIKYLNIHHQGSSLGVVTLSFGVASLIPTTESSPAEFISAADQALYRAKAQGRNCIATHHH